MAEKIGRNHPCRCGSGKKYKFCHYLADERARSRAQKKAAPLGPIDWKAIGRVIEQKKAEEARREAVQGKSKPIISADFKDHKIVAVGNVLHWVPAQQAKSFTDFLGGYIRTVFTSDWGNAEIAKPLADRHPLLQWYDALCALQQKYFNSRAVSSMPTTGLVAAYYSLAYNLYLLQHNAEVQAHLLKRLKNRETFLSAVYETHVASWFILAGFKLTIENEDDTSSTHVEFTAESPSGKKYSVEAKQRDPLKPHLAIGNQLHKALTKVAKFTRIICINLNVRAETLTSEDAVFAEITPWVRGKEQTLTVGGAPAPPAYVFVTNLVQHLHLDEREPHRVLLADGFKIDDFGTKEFPSLTAAYKARQRHADVYGVAKAFERYQIPGTFDGELPEFAFGEAERRFIVGDRHQMDDGFEGVLEQGVVMESEKVSAAMVAAFLLSTTALIAPALAADRNWTGAIDNDWLKPGNWTPSSAPTSADQAMIDGVLQSTIGTPGAVASSVVVGRSGGSNATLRIENGGTLSDISGFIGDLAGSTGTATVTGSSSRWTNSGNFLIGNVGNGTLLIENGGTVSNNIGYIGNAADADGTVTVAGSGSRWINSGNLFVGYYGKGTLTASTAGVVTAANTFVGAYDGSSGELLIESGGTLSDVVGIIGNVVNTTGTAKVTGTGSQWVNSDYFIVGNAGNGTLRIENGGAVSSTRGYIGNATTSTSAATVTGPGTKWNNTGNLYVGYSGHGGLLIENGGTISDVMGVIGNADGSSGAVTVTGAGSEWINSDHLIIGNYGTGALTISDRGLVSAANASSVGNRDGSTGTLLIENEGSLSNTNGYIGNTAGSTGTATVTGPGSRWSNSSHFYVGSAGNGTLTIEDGGAVSNGHGIIGIVAASTGMATVTGPGSQWINSNNLVVGSAGTGALTVSGGGSVSANAYVIVGDVDKSNGTLLVESGGTLSAANGIVGNLVGSVGSATVTGGGSRWDSTEQLVVGNISTGSLAISDHGEVNSARARIGNGSDSTGTLLINSGGILNSTGSGTMDRLGAISGMLGNHVNSDGAAIVTGPGSQWTNGAVLVVGSQGKGKLDVTDGAVVASAAGSIGEYAGSSGSVLVDGAGSRWTMGDLYLGHTLTNPGGTSTLTISNGGEVSTANGQQYFRSSGSQIEAAVSTATVYLGHSENSDATINIGAASGDPAAAAGMLTADNLTFGPGAGTLVFNHTSNDYLFSPTMLGAGNIKIENGRTVLTGDSSDFNGHTIISNGSTLQVGDGTTNGAFAGSIVNSGILAFDRSDATTFAGTISGGGTVKQAGSGTTILTGNSTYSGGTTITGGTVQLGNGGTSGSITGDVINNGVLAFNRTDDTTFAGTISGSGDLVKQGSGTLRLDNTANAYGNTFVAAGTLIGNASSISGNIGNAGTVVFDQGSDASFAGNIAALNGTSGSMVKQGSGALRLTGSSALDWTVEAGKLTSSAERFDGNATIASGATFSFDQTADAAYAGTISGSGSFIKTGAGKLDLTGISSAFAGTSLIQAGTLAVNGELRGSLGIGAAGRLQGNGTVGNTIVSGTIAPGNSIGTLHVAGDISFNPGSIYEVEVNAVGQSDRIVASGTASIAGGSVSALAGSGNYAPQTQYTILTADGGRIGMFDGVTSNLAFLDPSLSYDANNVYLTMNRNDVSRAPQRQLAQGDQVPAAEEILAAALDRVGQVDLAGIQPGQEIVRRQVDKDDVGRGIEDAVGNGFPHENSGDATNDIVETVQVLDIQRRVDIDPRVEQLLNILPALGMAAAGGIGVRQLINHQKLVSR